jgi:hypothetical protein
MAVNNAEISSELVLKRVMLFKTGVGCFEKKGIIDLSAQNTVQLAFKPEIMDDLLKTFLIFRESGDLIVTGISMDLKEMDTEKMLEKTTINIPMNEAFTVLIQQLQGVRVKIGYGNEQKTGIVMGYQEDIETSKENEYSEKFVVLFDETNSIIKILDTKIESLEILDIKVLEDMKFFLDIISSARKADIKNITIFFKGTKKSEYLIRFLQSIPAWKINYRMDINPPSEANSDNKQSEELMKDPIKNFEELNKREVKLQAWTILDNVLDEDWKNVELTLISGLPISFIYDSYSPNYGKRPNVSRDRNLDISSQRTRSSSSPPRESEVQNWLDRYEREYQAIKAFEDLINKQVKKGAAYTFKIKNPVSIMRNNSAMVPLFEKSLKGIKMCVYNEAMQKDHPMLTIKIKNETEIPLDEGTVAIFEENIFAGEAIMPFVNKTQEQQLPYSVDQSIEISKIFKSEQTNHNQIVISDVVIAYYYNIDLTNYKVFNNSNQNKLLIIEHPKKSGYELFETDKPIEETQDYYRFLLLIEPFGKKTVAIKLRNRTYNYISLDNLNSNNLTKWETLNILTPKQKLFIKGKLDIRAKIDELNKKKAKLQAEKNEIANDQNRIRSIKDALLERTEEEPLQKVLLAKLRTQENKNTEIRNEENKISKEIIMLTEELRKPFKEDQL